MVQEMFCSISGKVGVKIKIVKDVDNNEYCVSLRKMIKLCGKPNSEQLFRVKEGCQVKSSRVLLEEFMREANGSQDLSVTDSTPCALTCPRNPLLLSQNTHLAASLFSLFTLLKVFVLKV